MKIYYNLLLSIFLLLVSSRTSCFSQQAFDTQLVVYNQIAQLIEAKYGQGYDFGYTMFDVRVQYSSDEEIQDPYGTLKGCVLFSAYKPDLENYTVPNTFIVGMVKNGQIIWDNYPGSTKDLEGGIGDNGLKFAQDINNDGEVDLVFIDAIFVNVSDKSPVINRIHILSWNGTRGRFISGEMVGSADCNLIDVDGDGVQEIRTRVTNINHYQQFKTSTYPYVTYGWNGTQYGLWPNVRQIPESEFLPANRFQATVKCVVTKMNEKFTYLYRVSNQADSKQKIETIYIMNGAENIISELAPAGWSGSTSTYTDRTFFYASSDRLSTKIKSDTMLSGFGTTSFALPTIVRYYLQGYTGGTTCCPSDEEERHNILTNSVTGYTLGTRDTSVTFGVVEWCDTLANYTNQSFTLGWIKTQSVRDKYINYFTTAKTKLMQRDSVGARTILLQALKDVDIDSTASLSSETYALLRYNTEYLANRLPQAQAAPFFAVKLVSSNGTKLISGALQYYEGAWKDATNNQDGTFSINTSLKALSLRMTYEYGTQTKSNVPISNDTIVFQTVNAQIQLQNSSGNLIDTGSVQYYAGAWRILGTTINGVANKELLPGNYTFRMTYAYASKDKQQDIGTNAIVIFQTVNSAVQLKNSQGNLIDQGTVQYYSGAWRDLGTTTNGIANKELLPNNYSFRMSYAYASKDKQQDISTNATVVFQTVNAVVQLQNSQGSLIDQGTVQYYSGAWRDIGTTTNGVANKELLPNNYSFRMSYAYASKDKQQDISTNATVVFQTVNATVQLQNSQGTLMPAPLGDQGTVQYYSGAWRDFGITANGVANKELLPNNYSFRMTYAFASKDKQQDIGINATVVFQTVNTSVQLKNSLGNLIDQGTVQYYSGAWRNLGTTTNGTASKELLPNNYSFRMTYEYVSVDKAQDISTNSIVSFLTVLCTIKVKNSQNQLVDNALASYYSGAWRQIGNTVNGVITKELLPVNLSFRVKYGTQQQDKQQNLSTNNVVEFVIQ